MDAITEQLIDDYLFGRLPDDERIRLLEKAARNEDLQNAIGLRGLELEALKLADEDNLKKTMKGWKLDQSEETSATVQPIRLSRSTRVRYMSYAAGFLLIVFAGMLFYANSNYSGNALLEEYTVSRINSSRSFSETDEFELIKRTIDNEEYSLALQYLDSLDGIEANLLRAEVQHKQKNWEASLKEYQIVINTDSQLADEATFQHALVLLAAGQKKQAKIELRTIAENEDHPFAASANKVIDHIDKFWFQLTW